MPHPKMPSSISSCKPVVSPLGLVAQDGGVTGHRMMSPAAPRVGSHHVLVGASNANLTPAAWMGAGGKEGPQAVPHSKRK